MIAKLYIDTGSGFNGDQVLILPITGKEEKIEFLLKDFAPIQKIRFEPIADYLVLSVNKIEIFRADNGCYKLDVYSTNAVFKENGRLIFSTNAPQLLINIFNKRVERIVFLLKYEAIGKGAFEFIFSHYNSTLSECDLRILGYIRENDLNLDKRAGLEKENLENRAKLSLLRQEVEFLKQSLEAEKQVRANMLSSRSWSLTAPVRNMSVRAKTCSNALRTIAYRVKGEYSAIEKSGLFDDAYYLRNNPDVAELNLNPTTHYISDGAKEGRDPNPLFDTSYYVSKNPELVASEINPLVHFITVGVGKGKNPHLLFSTSYYLNNNPDVGKSGINPLYHFIEVGSKEGRDPNPLFDTSYYAARYQEVVKSGINPLVHYMTIGTGKGKDPHPLFSTSYYLNNNPDVGKSGLNPLCHYIEIGAKEGRRPHPLFDPSYYVSQSPEVSASSANPLVHYIETGARSGFNPHPLFDTSFYLSRYPEVAQSGMNPLSHYAAKGAKEGLNPNPLFDSIYYLRQNPDVAAAGVNPLSHYVQSGSAEGRNPNPLFQSDYYLKKNPDVPINGLTLLEHYMQKGAEEGKNPGPLFDARFYLEKYPDVARSGINPLSHYLEFGVIEGRSPNPQIEAFSKKPKISILVPIYNVKDQFLRETISSVIRQLYSNWELCLVDDGSTDARIKEILIEYAKKNEKIKIIKLNTNQGISNASNEAAALATGDSIGLLDHDDVLTMDALYETVKAINENDADIVYSDEGLIDEAGGYHDSIFKPDFSPDLLFSHNYITHFLVFKRSLFDEVGGFQSKYDGAQDYDLILKLTEKTRKIHHIQKVLYFWRKSSSSTSFNPENKTYAVTAGKLALEDALYRRKTKAEVINGNLPFFYRVKRELSGNPFVSIIIPFKDQPAYLKSCINTILNKSSYSNFEIIGINNGSTDDETLTLMKDFQVIDKRVRFFDYPIPFNYSKINNYGVAQAEGEIICLMNNDIEIINSDWIEALLEHGRRDEVGAVGGKLYYPNQTIQHAGVIIGIAGFAGHSHRHVSRDAKGYGNRLMCIQNVSAVSGALLMVRKRLYEEIGGLDEDNLTIALNDIDFCLRLRQKGYFNIFTPFCEAIHYESVSRGYEDIPERKMRFQKEIKYFQKKWKKALLSGDPFYNPNLTLERENFSLK